MASKRTGAFIAIWSLFLLCPTRSRSNISPRFGCSRTRDSASPVRSARAGAHNIRRSFQHRLHVALESAPDMHVARRFQNWCSSMDLAEGYLRRVGIHELRL
jgi:hypothetical protein